MAEYEPIQNIKEGHLPNIDVIRLELARLLAIFLSSEKFAEVRKDAGCDPHIFDILHEHLEDEITRILITLAVTARIVDDRENGIFAEIGANCGVLDQAGSSSDLSLREACNKIIHATKVRFDVTETEARQSFLNPLIYLYGSIQPSKEWKATLDLVKFAESYLQAVRQVY